MVFVKGVNFDVAKEAIKQPLIFKRSLLSIAGPVGEVKLTKDCVRVTCLSPRQKTALLNTADNRVTTLIKSNMLPLLAYSVYAIMRPWSL